ncbi:cell division ATP-binding protein FtsE [Oceanospirillum sediminis]|uniref:Cell division ATP-binding protein FtsE n=1 Tax=Oceanospirillum sediminis TaxID=2760088 RepID=A0A839IU07_9GAMM|nr:cell division ATP-binding protein FtsE [Oceanospirillum sediminis]MBB1488124.1 cell division ATP-binding protein FtsE [Oceanospirillum sediminis]
MIRFDNVSKRYENGHEALKQVSFTLMPGEMCFLTGHSGAGKSTLLKLIMRMEKATQGLVMVHDRNLSQMADRHVPHLRRNIGVVFQNHQLLFDRSVFDNVALPLVIEGADPSDIARRVRAALDKVGLLNKEKLSPIMLSGGEQQRVGIARAVVTRPPIILADEPTGNLDPKLSAEVMHLFRQFNETGVTILIASHDLDLVYSMGNRVLTLKDGFMISDGNNAV